jgi:predicted dehydrogenase
MLALDANKAVLVEKPFAMNLAQASEMVEAARSKGLFLMEAMWTRFLPQFRHVRRLLDDGSLGEVKSVVAEFGIGFEKDPNHRLYTPELGGGALLDLGIYPVSLAHFVFGAPLSLSAIGDFTFTGVDSQTSIVMRFGEGRQAILTANLEVFLPNRAVIAGEDALIEIDQRWHQPASLTLVARDGASITYDYHEEGNGLRHQAEEVARCLREGALESPAMTLDQTLSVMATMDEIRSQIGLDYQGT